MEILTTPQPLTFEQVMAILEKKHQDFNATIRAQIEADKKLHAEKMEKFEEKMEKLSVGFGNLTNSFGDLVEAMVAPYLCDKFNEYGFNFTVPNIRLPVSDGKKIVTDIDILLEDTDTVMAVEVKAKPRIEDIEKHLWRIEQIKKYPSGATRGMKVYGAIACGVLFDNVKEAAFEAGFYVVCQSGDNIDIIKPPDNFVPKYW